ncbi:hypothetical protein V6N12_002689 [Hibiscus sabdariffa]|uniref:Uncharacterized protein n=1 Tax=Hibiscus sabdariffa TaxID=183260 RepID=A0ABR2E9Q6_9ROSI
MANSVDSLSDEMSEVVRMGIDTFEEVKSLDETQVRVMSKGDWLEDDYASNIFKYCLKRDNLNGLKPRDLLSTQEVLLDVVKCRTTWPYQEKDDFKVLLDQAMDESYILMFYYTYLGRP